MVPPAHSPVAQPIAQRVYGAGLEGSATRTEREGCQHQREDRLAGVAQLEQLSRDETLEVRYRLARGKGTPPFQKESPERLSTFLEPAPACPSPLGVGGAGLRVLDPDCETADDRAERV